MPYIEQSLTEHLKDRKVQGKTDSEQGLKQLTEALRRLDQCPIEEVEQVVLNASLALKQLTSGMVDTAMARIYDYNAARCESAEALEELRFRQPALERTWKETIRRRITA